MVIQGKERFIVFGVGVLLGIILIGFIQKRRVEADPSGDSMMKKVFRDTITSTGIEPLPADTHVALRNSRLYSFDRLASPRREEIRKIWMLEMLDGPWPWVRVEALSPPDAAPGTSIGDTLVSAADRILVELTEGSNREQLTELAQQRGYMVRKFYAGENAHVVHLEDRSPMAIPVALAYFKKQGDLVARVDYHAATYF